MEVTWDLHIANQNGNELFVGVAPILEIDALSSVPHLPDTIGNNQASILLGEWAMDEGLGLTEWQRRPDLVRIHAIQNFMDANENNLMLNSIMLYIPEGAEGVTIERDEGDEKKVKIKIDMLQFLQPRGDSLVDVVVEEDDNGVMTYTDHRPIWIIDGQHRTRGMALSHRGAATRVPVTILHGEEIGGVDLTTIAKIFTEINTLAKPLNFEQQNYLAFKFGITSGNMHQNYGVVDEATDDTERVNRRANRMMYELACRLNTAEEGPFRAGVQLAKGNGPAQMARIKLNLWLKHIRSWFIGGPFSDPEVTIDDVYDELNAYFTAWSNTVNHEDYTYMREVPRWRPNYGGNQSHLERSDQLVRVVMVMLFPWARRIATLRELNYDVEGFSELLEPIRGVDWWDDRFETCFRQGGEPPAKWLKIWIQQAILHREVRSVEEVNSEDIGLVHHGKALYALPCNPEVELEQGAIDTVIQLVWDHGNVFTKPRNCKIITPQAEIPLDGEWTFDSEEELMPKIARYAITIENTLLETGQWRLSVMLENRAAGGTPFIYQPPNE